MQLQKAEPVRSDRIRLAGGELQAGIQEFLRVAWLVPFQTEVIKEGHLEQTIIVETEYCATRFLQIVQTAAAAENGSQESFISRQSRRPSLSLALKKHGRGHPLCIQNVS